MATATRLYAVRHKSGATPRTRLVEATNRAQALRHVAEDDFEVTVPSAKAAAAMVRDGASVEVAGDE